MIFLLLNLEDIEDGFSLEQAQNLVSDYPDTRDYLGNVKKNHHSTAI